jgi:hypothetical protein
VVEKFAYTRETPYVQPFETIESPWADFIKSDSMETNIKKLYKLAQKYSKSQTEKDKKAEEKAEDEVEEEEDVKPKPQRKERAKLTTRCAAAPRPRRATEPKGKEKEIAISDNEDEKEKTQETQGVLTRAQLEVFQSRWKSLNAQSKLSFVEKQEILLMATRLGIQTGTTGRGFQKVDKILYDKLNERFGTNFSMKKSGIRMKR